MPTLMEMYSIEQIILFIVVFAVAVKGLIDFYDWARKRVGVAIDTKNEKDKIREDIDKLLDMQVEQNKIIDELTQSVELLLKSDKDEIKAWITEKHHYFVYELKYIDDYSLDCIEKRYAHYKAEGGNSFVADLMEDIRSLPVASSPLGSVHRSEDIKK